MRWIWLKRASKYLCIESDQRGPLIYALNLTEKGLQIFMHRIWPKRASLIYMCWIWLKRAFKYWDLFGRGWNLVWVVEVISVPLYILGGGGLQLFREVKIIRERFKLFLKGIRCFRKWLRFFWVVEIFSSDWDFSGGVGQLGLFPQCWVFSGSWKFFHGNWKLFWEGMRYFQSD